MIEYEDFHEPLDYCICNTISNPPCAWCTKPFDDDEIEMLRIKARNPEPVLLTDDELDFEYAKLRHFQYVTELYAEAIESIMGSVYLARKKFNLLNPQPVNPLSRAGEIHDAIMQFNGVKNCIVYNNADLSGRIFMEVSIVVPVHNEILRRELEYELRMFVVTCCPSGIKLRIQWFHSHNDWYDFFLNNK